MSPIPEMPAILPVKLNGLSRTSVPVLPENSTASAEEELIWKLPPVAIVASGFAKAEYVKLSIAKCVPLPSYPALTPQRTRTRDPLCR